MKAYEITAQFAELGIRCGIMLNGDAGKSLMLGAGRKGKRVSLFRKNKPDVNYNGPWVGTIFDVHPVRISDGFALAKPNRKSDRILVRISTRATPAYDEDDNPCRRYRGDWRIEKGSHRDSRTFEEKVLAEATGPIDFYVNQDDRRNVGWHDALVTMEVGDIIKVTDENGAVIRAKYESIEAGLIQL